MRIEGVLFWVFPHRGECEFREKNILGKSCTTFVIVKIVRNLSRGRSPCQRVNHVKSGVIYFSAFIFSYDTIHVSGTIQTWNRGLTATRSKSSNQTMARSIPLQPSISFVRNPKFITNRLLYMLHSKVRILLQNRKMTTLVAKI